MVEARLQKLSLLRLRRIIGFAFAVLMLAAPFISEGVNGVGLFHAIFFLFPFPLVTWPYMALATCLAVSKKLRRTDAIALIACAMLLLSLLL